MKMYFSLLCVAHPRLLNQGNIEVPEITIDDINSFPKELKHNKSPDVDGIVIEGVKVVEEAQLSKIKYIFNLFLDKSSFPKNWNKIETNPVCEKGIPLVQTV